MKRVSVAEVKTLFREYGADAWLELVQRHGKTVRLQQFVLTCDTRLVEPLMLNRAHTRRRSISYRRIQRVTPGSEGLLFLDGPRWEVHHRAVLPTFVRRNLVHFADIIHAATQKWVYSCRGDVDLVDAITGLGARIVLQTGYGLDPADPLAREYAHELIAYKEETMQRDPRCRLDVLGLDAEKVLALPWLSALFVSLHRRVARMRRLVPRLLDQRARCPVRNPNWLDRLVAAQLSLTELTDALNPLYGAYNTVDTVTAAALYELSRHPKWRQRVRSELTATLGARPHPTADDITRLPLLWGANQRNAAAVPGFDGYLPPDWRAARARWRADTDGNGGGRPSVRATPPSGLLGRPPGIQSGSLVTLDSGAHAVRLPPISDRPAQVHRSASGRARAADPRLDHRPCRGR